MLRLCRLYGVLARPISYGLTAHSYLAGWFGSNAQLRQLVGLKYPTREFGLRLDLSDEPRRCQHPVVQDAT